MAAQTIQIKFSCPVLTDDPKETCESSQDCVSLSGSLSSCEEFSHNTGAALTSTRPSPEPEYNVVTYPGNSPLVKAVAVGEDRNELWRKDMEDTSVFIDNYGGKEGTSFFGVCDGFHGSNSAKLAARELPVLLLEQLVKFNPLFSLASEQRDFLSRMETLFESDGPPSTDLGTPTKDTQMMKAFTTAFARMDRILGLGRNETSRFRWSGCTSVVCLVDQDMSPEEEDQKALQGTMHIANCGNIHAVLYQNGKSFRVTKDYSTANSKERERILKEGGTISTNKYHGLVEGLLCATRALGNYGDRKLRKLVPPEPYYVPLSLDTSCGLLVLGSGGLWDILQPEDVAPIVQRCTLACGSHPRWVSTPHVTAEQPGRSSSSTLEEIAEKTLDKAEKWPEASLSLKTLGEQEGGADTEGPEEPSAGSNIELEEDYEGLAASICRKLMKAAVDAGSKDNITVMVVLLQGLEVLGVQSEERDGPPPEQNFQT